MENEIKIQVCELKNVEMVFFDINNGEYQLSGEDLLSACALFLLTKKEMEEDNEKTSNSPSKLI